VTEPSAKSQLEPAAADDAPRDAPLVEGTYIAPGHAPTPARWKKAGALAVGVGLLVAKAKALLLVLLNFKWFLIGAKVFVSAFGFVASVWFYALFFGWPFALVFMLLILVHECGHAIFMRAYGVPASMPYFIPGFGALIAMKGRPASAQAEAYIALAGPFVGSLAALACFAYGAATGERFWLAAAYTGFLLNLFNLFPVMPLDGGRAAGAISPRIWIFGLVAMIAGAFWLRWFNPLLLVLVLLGIPQAIAAFRGRLDERYYALTLLERGTVAVLYFGLAALLCAGMLAAHVPVPSPSGG
jgi:Zn-dependent protease